MSLPREMDPKTLSQRRDITVVDIRGDEERAEIGWIPGSYPFSTSALRSQPWELMALVPAEQPMALVCMSGRRSLRARQLAHDVGFSSVCSLAGGVLGWAGAGLPLVVPRPPAEPPPASLAALEQELTSCFTAERIEQSLRSADASALRGSPRAEVRELLAQLRAGRTDQAAVLDEAISQLALRAWASGHPLAHIAANITRMRGWLTQLRP